MGKEIHDYLTKQLFIDRSVVTFRSLSRQFKIHVNAAKNELADFHANPDPSASSVHATFLLTGELASSRSSHGDGMDVDGDMNAQEEDDGEQVPEVKVTLVGEQDLESVKSSYARVFSQHVYCLSPSPVIDAGLVCTPSEKVYETDTKLKQDEAALLGRVVGPHVQKGKPVKFTAVPAKEPLARKPTEPSLSKTSPKDGAKKDEKPAEQKKLKSSGTLDWSKAKPKQPKVDEKSKVKDEPKEEKLVEDAKPKTKPSPPAKSLKPAASKSAVPAKPEAKPEPKRGVKRKSALDMDSSSEDAGGAASSRPSSRPSSAAPSSPAPSPPPTQVPEQRPARKRLVVVSDDEDDVPPRPTSRPAAAKGKATALTAETESDMDLDALPGAKARSLRAMMDIDDDQVIRASTRTKAPPPPPSTEADSDIEVEADEEDATKEAPKDEGEDVEMEDDYEASLNAAKPRRRRAPKKRVPLGRNGLPKRRTQVSKTSVDANGYIATWDESEYESVEEGDPDAQPAPPPPKGKKAARATKAAPPEDERTEDDGDDDDDKDEKEKTEEKAEKGAKYVKDGKKAQEEKKGPRRVIRAGQPVKRSSGSKVSAQGSLKNFFGKK